ncbi:MULTISPECIES: hypothetical protein [unclassified Variovorax]|uniref:hypothetical protein n=1 Tax=unclassified Variovorax TaxID=663243 RepID=UPI003ED04BB8
MSAKTRMFFEPAWPHPDIQHRCGADLPKPGHGRTGKLASALIAELKQGLPGM